MLFTIENDYSAIATVITDTKRACSAVELRSRCDGLIEDLQRYGIASLGLYANNSIDWVVADLACQKADICILPVPTFFSLSQIEHALTTCQFDALLTDNPEVLATLVNIGGEHLGKVSSCNLDLILLKSKHVDSSFPEGTGKITFTSGSTGQPRGVCLSNAQLRRQANALAQTVALQSPRHLCLLPLSTLLENVAGVYAPLLAGGSLVVPTQESLGFRGSSLVDQQKLIATISKTEPDSIILVPQLLLLLVAAISRGWKPPQSLKFIAVGGSKVSAKLLNQARSLGLPVYEGYGLSECCSVVSLNTAQANRPGSCGRPLQYSQLSFEEGEVCVAGNAMLGYTNEPETWNQSMIRTGDLGHLDFEGFLHIDGRKKNLLISSFGRNISPEWVESELLVSPLLSEAVVLGDAQPYCTALVTARSSQTSDSELERWIGSVNQQLPDYARIKCWHRLSRPLAEQQGLLTENGRPKRERINKVFATEIENLYGEQAVA